MPRRHALTRSSPSTRLLAAALRRRGLYWMDDAEVAVFLLNSAAETAKDVADRLRVKGVRAGVLSPNVVRPFPAADDSHGSVGRAGGVDRRAPSSYGAHGANFTDEVKSASRTTPTTAPSA